MEKKITIMGVLTEGLAMGVKNVIPLILTFLLWIFTIWIPYINVGTTIAITTIPLELSKGNIINPLFIFNAKYRQYMGEYFIIMGLIYMAIGFATLFFFIPAVVISIAWSLAVLIMFDKKISPLEAIMASNKATYGYKWTIFGSSFCLGLIGVLAIMLFGQIPYVGWIFCIAIAAVLCAASWSCTAVIYRDLTAEKVAIEEPKVVE